jgi:hypothetical protein
MTEKRSGPKYKGMIKHVDIDAGYALWLPSDWTKIDMVDGHDGVIFTPYPDDINTCIAAEKRILEDAVTDEDIPVLRQAFHEAVRAMPEVEVEKFDEAMTATLKIFDAVFSYNENGTTRKRWVRNVYWGEAQLIIIAQGATPEEYEHWLPMFFNTLMTAEAGNP